MIVMGKFQFDLQALTITIPDVYDPRYVGYDEKRDLCLWAEIDEEARSHKRHACIIGSHQTVPEDMTYVGTSSPSCGSPWHLYIGSKIESVNRPPPPPPPPPPPLGGGLI